MNVFEFIQDQIDLSDVARRFTELKPSGTRLLGCCPLPNHQDSTPSFFVYPEGRWYCFGCREHGDVVDLWAKCRGLQPGIAAALDLAREYGLKLPDSGPNVQRRAEERRNREAEYMRQAEACHQALSSHPHIIAYLKQRGFAEKLQERFLLGTNRDGTAVVIPFWHRGRIQGLIHRQLDREPKYLLPTADSFASGNRPLFIPGTLYGDLHLAEGYFDALVLAALGLSAIAPGGTGISAQQMEEIENLTGSIYIFPDADEAGTKAANAWMKELYPRARLCPAEYGKKADGTAYKDVAELFETSGSSARQVIEELKTRAVDALDLALAQAPASSTRERYNYAKEHILPLLLRLENEGERIAALNDVATRLGLKSELKRAFKSELKLQSESKPESDKGEETDSTPLPNTERYKRAIELLTKPDLLKLAVADMERLGHVGEPVAKQLAFICALSARAGRPIQPSTHAQSSSGKNALWDTVLALIPPENVVTRSALSAKALYRTQANLKGGILYIQEVAGSEDAEYTIRVMQSGGCLEYEATEKAPDGSMRNVVHKVEGPTVIIQTTTKNHLHPENETRVFPIYIDESEQQTRRIIQSILKEAAGGGLPAEVRQAIVSVWRDAIRLLEPGDVVIPFAEGIRMPASAVRIRRDARRLLDVVRVITWLHQRQRKRDRQGRIMATEEDFHLALQLVSESLTRAWQTLTTAEQKVLEAIQKLQNELQTGGFKRRDLKVLGISDRRVKEILRSLADTGYLDCDSRQGPQGYTYTVAREMESVSLGITLAAQPPDSQIDTRSKEDRSGESELPDSSHSPENLDDTATYQVSGATGRNGHRPLNPVNLEQLDLNGRISEVDKEDILNLRANRDSEQWVEMTGDLDSNSDGRNDESLSDRLSPIPSDEIDYPKEDWGEL